MYIVYNLTPKTVIIADIRVEIGPHKILDLELVTGRDSIERSYDLKKAMEYKQLRIVKFSAIKTPKQVVPRPEIRTVERTIEKHTLDEGRLEHLIRKILSENKPNNINNDIEQKVEKMFHSGAKNIISSIRDELRGFKPSAQSETEEVHVDPVKLAEIQQKAIEKVSQDIEGSSIKQPKKITIINKNKISDLADEM